jgi:dipeptidyl aminopeptidase/acylaminoacyl peptidase
MIWDPGKLNRVVLSPSLSGFFALLIACAASAAAQEPGYPVKDFLGITSVREVQVSPDGRRVAFITVRNDFERDAEDVAVWLLEVGPGGRPAGLARVTRGPVNASGLRWSPSGQSFAVLSTRESVPTPQLFVFDAKGGEPPAVTRPEQFAEGIVAYAWAPDGGSIVFAAASPAPAAERGAREEFYGDAIRFAEGVPRTTIHHVALAAPAPQSIRPIATIEGTVAELCVSPDGRQIAYLSGPPGEFNDGPWNAEIFLLPIEGGGPPRQLTRNLVQETGLMWSADSKSLYTGGDNEAAATRMVQTQASLYRIPLADGRITEIASAFEGEFGEAALLADGSLLVLGGLSTEVNAYRIEPNTGRVDRLSSFRGSLQNLSASRDGKLVAFALAGREAFPELFLAPGPDSLATAVPVTDFNAALTKLPRSEIETVRWPNGEGDTIEGVLHWPPGRRGAKNLPFVVVIHGGPWLADTETLAGTYIAYPALLASRGYLVLKPNYRGSTGRGEAFLHAIEGYACSRPSTDILAGVDHVVAQGWADAARLGVMGYSYGGVLTNCLIGRTTRFRAAASSAGVWNYTSRFGTANNFYVADILYRGKAPWENIQHYWEESAISRAGNIKTPTLVMHGGNDRGVPTMQGYEVYRALVRLEVPTELLVFPGEGHVFRKPSHKLTKVRAELAWFDHYLLGRPLPGF